MCLLSQPHVFRPSGALNLLQGKDQEWLPITTPPSEGADWCSCGSTEAHGVLRRESKSVFDSGRCRKGRAKILDCSRFH